MIEWLWLLDSFIGLRIKESSVGNPLQKFSGNLEIVDWSTLWEYVLFWTDQLMECDYRITVWSQGAIIPSGLILGKKMIYQPSMKFWQKSGRIKNCLNWSRIKNCKTRKISKLCGLISPLLQKLAWSYLVVSKVYNYYHSTFISGNHFLVLGVQHLGLLQNIFLSEKGL